MLLLTARSLGAVTVDRLVRDRMATALGPTCAIATDLASSPSLAAIALADAVPTKGALHGNAALWVWSGACVPWSGAVEVAVPRGCHPDQPPAWTQPWRYVTDGLAVTRAVARGGVKVAAIDDAAAAALARADLGLALTLLATLGPQVNLGEVRRRIGSLRPAGNRRRAAAALAALQGLCDARGLSDARSAAALPQ